MPYVDYWGGFFRGYHFSDADLQDACVYQATCVPYGTTQYLQAQAHGRTHVQLAFEIPADH